MTPPRGDKHWVYLHIDADGGAIYAGCTNNPAQRLAQHKYSPWWDDIDDVVHIGPFDRRTALGIERELIAELDPPANCHGTTRDARKPQNRPGIIHRPEYAQIRGRAKVHYAMGWGAGQFARSVCSLFTGPRDAVFTSDTAPDCKSCQWVGESAGVMAARATQHADHAAGAA